jgi:hypothetical protein
MPRKRWLIAAGLVVLAGCGQGAESGGGKPAPRSAPPRVITVTPEDMGATVTLRLGDRIVASRGGADGTHHWAVARYPRAVLRLLPREETGTQAFVARASGRGRVLLLDLGRWPGGDCERALRRCVLPFARKAPLDPDDAGPLRVLSFEVVVE